MKVGKLTPKQLNQYVLSRIKTQRAETLVGAGLGEDCAVLNCKDLVFLSTDPITGAVSGNNNIGSLAVNIACNDIAGSGATPIAVMLTLMLPPFSDNEEVGEIMQAAQAAASKLGVDIVGGHTEFTDAVTRTIVSATAVGMGTRLLRTSAIREGDDIVVTKTVGLEGTSIIANDYAERLDTMTRAEIAQARAMVDDVSVVKEGAVCAPLDISCMHDITEGGVLGAISELGKSNGLGAVIRLADIPVHPITKKLCDALSINPYRLLSSGSMLICSRNGPAIVDALTRQGIKATVIGKFTASTRSILTETGELPLSQDKDELGSLLDR